MILFSILKSQNSYLSPLFFSKMAHYWYTGSKTWCSSCFSAFKQNIFSSFWSMLLASGIMYHHICSVLQLCPNNTDNSSESSTIRDTPAGKDQDSVLDASQFRRCNNKVSTNTQTHTWVLTLSVLTALQFFLLLRVLLRHPLHWDPLICERMLGKHKAEY